MLKRLMQSLQSTCTWKHRVGVERWHYHCTWHQYVVIKITDCSENPSKNGKGSGKVWENDQIPGKRYYGEKPRHQFVYFAICFFLGAIGLGHRRTTLNVRYCNCEVTVNRIKLHCCFYPYYNREVYLKLLLVLIFKWCLHSLSLANVQQHLCPALSICTGSLHVAWLCSIIICPSPATSLVYFGSISDIKLLWPSLQFLCPSSFIPESPSSPEIPPSCCEDFHYLTEHFSFPFKALNFPDAGKYPKVNEFWSIWPCMKKESH